MPELTCQHSQAAVFSSLVPHPGHGLTAEGLTAEGPRSGSRAHSVIAAVQIYLTTLESVKTYSMGTTSQVTGSEAGAAAAANFVAGGTASLVTQSVIVPVDVVSQRLMVAGERKQAATDCKDWGCIPGQAMTNRAPVQQGRGITATVT